MFIKLFVIKYLRLYLLNKNWYLPPWKRSLPSFPATPCKNWSPVKPPLFRNLIGGSTAHTMVTILIWKFSKWNHLTVSSTCHQLQYSWGICIPKTFYVSLKKLNCEGYFHDCDTIFKIKAVAHLAVGYISFYQNWRISYTFVVKTAAKTKWNNL